MLTSDLSITLVTVTYGKRGDLLRKVLESTTGQGVQKAVVVNNGSTPAEVERACENLNLDAHIVDMGRNTGSAVGFATGLETALSIGSALILILDDDNLPCTGAVSAMGEAWQSIARAKGEDNTIVLGFRPDHQADVAQATSLARINPHCDSFFGFCIQDVPRKILKRVPVLRSLFSTEVNESYQLETAPYSGMLFHSDVLRKFGLPMKDLVLYVDDTEYTYRITRGGGSISLITSAQIEDLEASWSIKKNYNSTFKAYLHGGSDFRAFYAARNQSYFETHKRQHNKLLRSLNKWVYMFALYLLALKDNKLNRYRLFQRSVKLGEQGVLGVSPEFPLA